jgi:hypothetical protein
MENGLGTNLGLFCIRSILLKTFDSIGEFCIFVFDNQRNDPSMQCKTIHSDSVRGFITAWEEHTHKGFTPNAAIVFTSVELDLKEIIRFLHAQDVNVFGCSSCGEFLFSQKAQVISDGGIVCLMMAADAATFGVRLFSSNGITSFETGMEIGKWAAGLFEKPAILVLGSGIQTDGEQLVRGIQSQAGDDVIMFGGLAGDDARFAETFVFSENELRNHGAIAMVFDTRFFDIQGIATSGWIGIGADKVVTRAEGNVVYTIDGQPALEVYKEYLSITDTDLPEIGVEYPLLIKRPGAPDVLRAVINVDRKNKSLIFAGTVPNGATVTFSSSPGFEIIEFTRKKIMEFYEQNRAADMLILFSCMARHNALGPAISEEIQEAWQQWNKPLIGFFTYGEIGNNNQASCDFHNETFTLVTLKQTSDVA